MSIEPDKLIPPDSELAHLLLQWSEDEDTRTWRIANVTNDFIEEVESPLVTKTDIYKAVAKRCKGRKWNTIRRIAEVAVDFDRDIQEKYAGLLSFEHFKVSRRLFNEGYAPTIDYALEWCVTGDDDKLTAGRFHTVGEMINQFMPKEAFENELIRLWSKSRERLYDLILIHDHDNQRRQMMEGWSQIDKVVGSLDKVENCGTLT